MPPQTTTNLWDFTPVLDLLHALAPPQPPESVELERRLPLFETPLSYPEDLEDGHIRGASLGDFDRIFAYLNQPLHRPSAQALAESPDEESPLSGCESTPPTTPPEHDEQHLSQYIRTKEVRWEDEVEDATVTGKTARNQSAKHRKKSRDHNTGIVAYDELSSINLRRQGLETSILGNSKDYRKSRSIIQFSSVDKRGGFESETDERREEQWIETRQAFFNDGKQETPSRTNLSLTASAKSLTPAWVTPPQARPPQLWVSPSPAISVESGKITPILYLTRNEKKVRLFRMLLDKFSPSALQNIEPSEILSEYGGNCIEDGIHVFVDSSNIAIGFYDSLKRARGIDIHVFTRRAPLSFHSLALIMERGRGVARRVLVGSSERSGKLPDYMREAARCGYEINSLDRVEKYKEDASQIRSRHRRSGTGNGYGTSGQSSGSETPYSGVKIVTEQGVDEILHMKMLESMIDAQQPSTIVLASGDAAEAEFSGGFLKNVERALKKGWKVELVAWKHSLSAAYRSKAFLAEWKRRFLIVELDDFTEELLGLYVAPKDVQEA